MPKVFLTNEDKEELIERIGDTSTDSKYFDIDHDGIVSLKAEYRGHPDKTTYPYAVSDNGINKDGSKINELPEKIVIPDVVGKTAVTGFQAGMFHYNYRVKEIVLPDGVTALPDYFCRYARNLRAIHNTENITTLGGNVISYTMIEKALFPNLTSIGASGLGGCSYLKIADIGNNIAEIPQQCFAQCTELSLVKGGSKVTTIGKQAFMVTENLKNLPFLSLNKVTSIGNYAFYKSRIQFNWSSLTGCTFGTQATPVIDNPTDLWSGVTFTACENPLNTLMSQQDPRWTDNLIGDCTNTDRKYSKGCSVFVALHIHSALSGTTYSHPDEFVAELKTKGYTITNDHHPRTEAYAVEVFEKLGYKVTSYIGGTAKTTADYQVMCDALARGAYVYTEVSTTGDVDDGHGVCIYGINDIKEVLVVDSDYLAVQSFKEDGVDRDKIVYSIPFINLCGPNSDFIIVEKQ